MRRPLLFWMALGATLFFSVSSNAGDERWLHLSANDRGLVDRIAADLYQTEVQAIQSRAIESQTSSLYTRGEPVDRARFRAQRRDDWRSMSAREQAHLRNAKAPQWRGLTDYQKAPFRQRAMNILGVVLHPADLAPPPSYGRDI